MNGAVVLLSGGLDSSFNFYKACEKYSRVLALTVNYGQRAFEKELEAARNLVVQKNVSHKVLDLTFFADFTKTALVNADADVPTDEVSIDDKSTSDETAKAVWVPNRNGILLNVAAGFAEGLGYEVIVPGFNREEAVTFPDNSADFCRALEGSFHFSTANHVGVECFSLDLNKTEIVAEAQKVRLPLEQLWPCYHSGDEWCGECESCQRFARALDENGLKFDSLNGARL